MNARGRGAPQRSSSRDEVCRSGPSGRPRRRTDGRDRPGFGRLHPPGRSDGRHVDRIHPVGLQSAHRPQPGLQPAVITLAPVVLVLLGVVEGRGD